MTARSNDEHAAQRIETAALWDLHDAAGDTLRRRLALHCHERGGTLISVAGGDPSILINRTTGLGVFEPATRGRVEEIVAAYREASIPRFFVQHHPRSGPPEIAEWLAAAGLERQRAWMKFRHDHATVPEPAGDLAPEPVDADHAQDFGAIAAEGFDLKPETAPLLARLVGRPGWHPFMVRIDGEVAGVAALLIHEQAGWCDWASTRPAFRGRGVQRALLAARLHLARDSGCRVVYTTTGAAVPGDPQHSYNNILNAGFEEFYLSENFAPPRSG